MGDVWSTCRVPERCWLSRLGLPLQISSYLNSSLRWVGTAACEAVTLALRHRDRLFRLSKHKLMFILWNRLLIRVTELCSPKARESHNIALNICDVNICNDTFKGSYVF